MGIDFNYGNAQWSYGGFSRFREKLAKEIKLNLNEMKGFGGDKDWPSVNEEPIVHLLNHSDCDGYLTPDQCKQIIPRLKELVKDWYEEDFDKGRALLLAEGMEEAVTENQNLEFM